MPDTSTLRKIWLRSLTPVFPIPILVIILAISLWLIRGVRPWPLVVIHGDISSFFGDEPWLFGVLGFLFNFSLLALMYFIYLYFSRVKARITTNQWWATLAMTTGLVASAFFTYPEVKSYLAFHQISESGGGPEYIVIVYRNVYSSDETRWSSTVWSTSEVLSLDELPDDWPFFFLEEASTRLEIVNSSQIEVALESLKEGSFFEFPEQVDPRPSLNQGGLYVAIYRKNFLKRTFCRVSEPRCEDLWSAAKKIQADFSQHNVDTPGLIQEE